MERLSSFETERNAVTKISAIAYDFVIKTPYFIITNALYYKFNVKSINLQGIDLVPAYASV